MTEINYCSGERNKKRNYVALGKERTRVRGLAELSAERQEKEVIVMGDEEFDIKNQFTNFKILLKGIK